MGAEINKAEKPAGMGICLRRAGPTDIETLIALEQSVSETKIYSPMLTEGEWTEEMNSSEVYLIEKDGIVVGNISYEKKSKSHLYISGLVVDPSFQGQGIARMVLETLLEKFKTVKRIDLVTHPDNRIALNLYQSLGFGIETRKENYYGDGEPRLILVLKK